MRRFAFIALIVALATVVHVDWHVARPTHHRLSLGWEQHWLFAAIAFGIFGWVVARTWPHDVWRRGGVIALLAFLLAQGVEPIAEVALYLHRFGYPDDPGRWTAFFVCIGVGLPAYALALRYCRPSDRQRVSRTLTSGLTHAEPDAAGEHDVEADKRSKYRGLSHNWRFSRRHS